MKRITIGIFIAIFVFTAGFVFLLRGCLSKYDERSVLLPILYFEKNDTPVIFSVVQYSKTTSYSQQGGFIQKTVNTDYYVQTNNGMNAAEIKHQEAKDHSDIKDFPVEVLGASLNKAWIYLGGLMAFNPFTLEKTADQSIIEKRNPSFRDRLPSERKYYRFSEADSNIYFTAKDGSKWILRTADLSIVTAPDEGERKEKTEQLMALENLERSNREKQDSNYRRSLKAGTEYAKGILSRNAYNTLTTEYYRLREANYKERDSLSRIRTILLGTERAAEAQQQLMQSLNKLNPGYTTLKVNTDTINFRWYGLYDHTEFSKISERYQPNSLNDETARRNLYAAALSNDANGNLILFKDSARIISNEIFLHGGFLTDRRSGQPIHFAKGWLIVHRQQIGTDAAILISAVNPDGNIRFTFNTALHEWLDWRREGNRLYIFGNDNPKLMSSKCNILICIDLRTGIASRFDYFVAPGSPRPGSN